MIVAMLIPVARSGYDYGKTKADVDAAIDTALVHQTNMSDQWNKILQDQSKLTQEIKVDIITNLDTSMQLESKLREATQNAATQYTAIQITGIIFIALIAFLYILKAFGFLHDINEAIVGWFR